MCGDRQNDLLVRGTHKGGSFSGNRLSSRCEENGMDRSSHASCRKTTRTLRLLFVCDQIENDHVWGESGKKLPRDQLQPGATQKGYYNWSNDIYEFELEEGNEYGE